MCDINIKAMNSVSSGSGGALKIKLKFPKASINLFMLPFLESFKLSGSPS